MSTPDRFEPDNELFADGPVHIEHLGNGKWYIGTPHAIYEIEGERFFQVDDREEMK